MSDTKNSWENILKLLKAIPNNSCYDVNAPATTREIKSLEEKIGIKLPDSFKEYLSVSDGQKDQFSHALIGYMNFFDISTIIEVWSNMVDEFDGDIIDWKTEDKIKPVIWDKGWIPFTSNGGGSNMMVLDMAPGKNGTVGQIFLWHPGLGDEDEITADSFEECSVGLLSRLTNKEYTISDLGVISFNDYYFV